MKPYKKTLLAAFALCGLMIGAVVDSARAELGEGPQNADEDSCYALISKCVPAKTEWKKDGEYQAQFTNNCGGRIVLKYCFEQKDGSRPSCGQMGLRQGQSSWPSVTSTYNGTERVGWKAVGALKPDMDWVCTSKVERWNDDSLESFRPD